MVTLAFLWVTLAKPQCYTDLIRRAKFLGRWSCFKFNNLGLALATVFKFSKSTTKVMKVKGWKLLGDNFWVCRIYRKKLIEGFLDPILNKLKGVFIPQLHIKPLASLYLINLGFLQLQTNQFDSSIFFSCFVFVTIAFLLSTFFLLFWQ